MENFCLRLPEIIHNRGSQLVSVDTLTAGLSCSGAGMHDTHERRLFYE